MMSTRRTPVTLRIMLTPTDLDEARHVLPHQLKQWGNQVDEVLCQVDVPARFRGSETHRELGALIESYGVEYPHLRRQEVEYSAESIARVGEMFYGGGEVPLLDYRDRPVYAYLYGLTAARHDLVFHLDGDMIFGGGSQSWIDEARGLLETCADVFTCSPLPGPPRSDGVLLSQRDKPSPYHTPVSGYQFRTFSSRLFMLDRRKLAAGVGPLRGDWPPPRPSIRVLLTKRERPYDILERVISRRMKECGRYRVDFLGTGLGMWGVHPLQRSSRYRALVPELIRRIEAGDVHESQRGEYDLTEGMLRLAEEMAAA